MHRGSQHERYHIGLDMCKVCTEEVHCVALWTRTLSQVWTCSSIEVIRYSYTSTIKTHNKKQNNGNMGNRVGGKTITQYVAPCNPKQWDHTHHTSTKYICTSPRHNVIKPKGQNSGKETASQANKCRHNKIHMNMNAFMPPPPPPRNPETPPPPRNPEPPPTRKTPKPPHVRNCAPSV